MARFSYQGHKLHTLVLNCYPNPALGSGLLPGTLHYTCVCMHVSIMRTDNRCMRIDYVMELHGDETRVDSQHDYCGLL